MPAFYAWGWGGQEIAVFPDHDAVAVFTGARYAQTSAPAKILGAHVIPALLSADPADREHTSGLLVPAQSLGHSDSGPFTDDGRLMTTSLTIRALVRLK